MKFLFASVDLGGTNVTAAILDEYRRREAAEKSGGKADGPSPVLGAGGY